MQKIQKRRDLELIELERIIKSLEVERDRTVVELSRAKHEILENEERISQLETDKEQALVARHEAMD